MYCTSTPRLTPAAVFFDLTIGPVTVGVGSVTVSVPIVSCETEKIDGPANTAKSRFLANGIIQIASKCTAFSLCVMPLCVDVTARVLPKTTGSGMLAVMVALLCDPSCENDTPARRFLPHTRYAPPISNRPPLLTFCETPVDAFSLYRSNSELVAIVCDPTCSAPVTLT